MTPLATCPKTNECHTSLEWEILAGHMGEELGLDGPNRHIGGSYDGEVYENWWRWDAAPGDWCWIGP